MNCRSRKITVIIFIFILSFVFVGCNSQNRAGQIDDSTSDAGAKEASSQDLANIEDYYPMSVGSTWEYEGSGNEYAAYNQRVLYNEADRYQIMTENGGTSVASVIEIDKDKIVKTYYEGEVYDNKNVLSMKSNYNQVLLKLPLSVGNKWTSEENEYEITKTDASITVPYGVMDDCIEVKVTYKDGSIGYSYYKKGIGLVETDFMISEDEAISSKLKSFVLK